MKDWKFCFYPVWNFLKIEAFLSKMESSGYRLEKKRFGYFWKFKKVAPRDVKYFLTYSPLGGSVSMHELEICLKGKYSANIIINETFESPGVYRICDPTKNPTLLRDKRDSILKKICLEKSFWSGLFVLLINLIFTLFIDKTSVDLFAHLLLTFPTLVYFLYNFAGYLILKSKLKGDVQT